MYISGEEQKLLFHIARSGSLVLCLAACPTGPQETTGTEGETSTSSGSTTGSTEPTTSGTTGTSGTSTGGTSSAGTTAVPACGDGAVDPGEACDDGNAVNGDGCNNDCSKSGEMLWEYLSGEGDYDDFRAVAAAEDGTIVAGGTRFSGAGHDRWLIRFDAEGNVVWSQNYDGAAAAESVLGLALDGTQIYATGNIDRVDGRELWVGALDMDGGLAWEDEYSSGFGDDYATGAAATAEGVVVAGIASVDGGLADLWVRGYAKTGEVQWTQTTPINLPAIYSLGPDVSVAPDQIFVGGYSQPAGWEPLLAAYPPGGGAPTWSKNVPPTNATIYGIARGGGDLVVAGEFVPSVGIYVERLTVDGEPVWSSDKCTGNVGKGVAVDSQGDVVVVGFGAGAVADNIRLCKFAADGEFRWGKDLDGGVGHDRGFAVDILPDDRIVAAGTSAREGTNGDGWLAVFSP